MGESTHCFPGRIIRAWVLSSLACGGFLAAVYLFAPVVLRHDRDTSVWYQSSLAEESIRQFHSLPRDADIETKKKLLEDAVSHIQIAHQLRPDSYYYTWLHGLSLYELAMLGTPPDKTLQDEALGMVQQLWEQPYGKTKNTARFLANHYLSIGQLDQASHYYGFILEQDLHDSLAYDGLVQVALKSGQTGTAAETLEKKGQFTHTSPEDRELLAALSIQSGNYGKAASSLLMLLESGGETKERWFLYGLALLGRGDTDSARRAFGVYKYAAGETVPLPEATSLGLSEYPQDLLPSLEKSYRSARPALEGFR